MTRFIIFSICFALSCDEILCSVHATKLQPANLHLKITFFSDVFFMIPSRGIFSIRDRFIFNIFSNNSLDYVLFFSIFILINGSKFTIKR